MIFYRWKLATRAAFKNMLCDLISKLSLILIVYHMARIIDQYRCKYIDDKDQGAQDHVL
jgi:hypothetical protein